MRTIRRPVWTILMVVLSGWTAACHTYTPVAAPVPGSTVRVQIPVRSPLDNPNAPTRTTSIEGLVVEAGDTVVLATESRREFGAFREIVQYDTIRLGPDQRSSVELREFSTGKSVALGVGLTGVVVLAAVAAFDIGGGQAGQGLPPNIPNPAIVRTRAVVSSSTISTLVGLLFGR